MESDKVLDELAAEVAKEEAEVQESLATAEEKALQKLQECKAKLHQAGYIVGDSGYLYYEKRTKKEGDENTELIPIANFVPIPRREIVKDNGLEKFINFEIEAIYEGDKTLPAEVISADKFATMNWVSQTWGMQPNVAPGYSNKDRLRYITQLLGQDIKREVVFTHLGWRRIKNDWLYLHADGAVNGEAKTELDTALHNYALPDTAGTGATSYRLLDIADRHATLPLLALTYLAVLGEPLRQARYEPAFVMWLTGRTGSLKSSLAALFLCHFGQFSGKSLPASFKDTANSIENRAFAVKDSLLVVDDYHPQSDKAGARKQEQIAGQILRAYGDRTGRARMKADTSLRPAYIPRGLCLATGEDLPASGQSSLARYLTIELKRENIDFDLLGEFQSKTDELARDMRGFIEWLAPQLDTLPGELRYTFTELRNRAQNGQHSRMPEIAAWLYIGLATFTNFLVEKLVITESEQETLLAEGWNIFLELAEAQARRIEEENPSMKFINTLSELLAAGQVAIKSLQTPETTGEGDFIGWYDSDWLYLLPDTVYRSVVKFTGEKGENFPVTLRTLYEHLDKEGLIFTEAKKNPKTGKIEHRKTVAKKPEGKTLRVLKLKKSAVINE